MMLFNPNHIYLNHLGQVLASNEPRTIKHAVFGSEDLGSVPVTKKLALYTLPDCVLRETRNLDKPFNYLVALVLTQATGRAAVDTIALSVGNRGKGILLDAIDSGASTLYFQGTTFAAEVDTKTMERPETIENLNELAARFEQDAAARFFSGEVFFAATDKRDLLPAAVDLFSPNVPSLRIE